MTATLRWTLALTAGLIALAGTGVAAALSGQAYQSAESNGQPLPILTACYALLAPFALHVALALAAINLLAATRGSKPLTLTTATLTSLLTLTWLILCALAWQLPAALLGVG